MHDNTVSFHRVVVIAVVVGIISGFGAVLFYEGLKFGTRFFMGNLLGYVYPDEGQSMAEIATWAPPDSIWLILPIICLGALASGMLVYRFAPEAEGHGTDAAVRAFHGEGKVRWRIPLLKAVTSILTMTTGGSAGREGPTAQISAGFGSIAADLLGLSARERRIALATGIGAGIGTIFKAPLGGAILGAEILYRRDFESEALVPSFLASIIGYAIFSSFEGFDPIFGLGDISWSIPQIPLFLLLGVVCAGMGVLYVHTFYMTQKVFKSVFSRFSLPGYLKPFTGAFIIGAGVVLLAQISYEGLLVGLGSLGPGYGFLQLAMYNMLPLAVLMVLPFAKILTTSLTIGSGGSGGVFAPGLAIGGSTGGAVGMVLHLFAPEMVPMSSVPVFVIVGMIALFGSIANAPISVLIMVVEMTANFSLFIPAMGAVAVADVLTGTTTIFREQVMTKAQSGAHRGEYQVEVLEGIRADDAMVPADRVITLMPDESCAHVLSIINRHGHTGFPVLEGSRLTGIITIGDVRNGTESGKPALSVRDVMARELVTIDPDATLEKALGLMMDNNIHHLPVVRITDPGTLAGFLTSSDILRAYTRVTAGEPDHQ
ncbi:MAG TPA: CBS domain-containing protein [Methanoculleus sp.]|nr:CBS domain-containing protein [Methanoculleus sp.]